jgi:hypothetical protein
MLSGALCEPKYSLVSHQRLIDMPSILTRSPYIFRRTWKLLLSLQRATSRLAVKTQRDYHAFLITLHFGNSFTS